MTKEEIEKEILERYPFFIERLLDIEKGLNTGLNYYLINNPEYIQNRDFRPGTLGRFISCSMTIRFQMDRTMEFLKTVNWDEIFIKNYAFEMLKESKYLGNFKDIDQAIRFYLFHSFYHQLETTIRIIHTELKLKKGKPLERVNEQIKCYPTNFIMCIDALRNTIHNNGYYRPLDGQPDTIEYKNEILDIKFKANDRTAINTAETILLIIDLLKFTEILLKSEQVRSIPLTADRN